MSVALPSPHSGRTNKRFIDETDDARAPFTEYNPQKRVRHVVSPSGRCGSAHLVQNPALAYTVGGASTFAALRALFPAMSDKVSI
jgi:hypothetical protein